MTHAPAHPLDDPLTDFERRAIPLLGVTRTVHVAGAGPAVIVLAEMPGISPDVARFARWVRDAGFSVYLPSLFGHDGAYPVAGAGLAVVRRACVSAEFRAFASGESSPVTGWLRALARLAHAERGGPGVGAIGMCFTGNFALTMVLEPAVLAPVLCQPSLPLDDPAALESPPAELAAIRARLERDDLAVLAYRFAGDRHCTAERFAAYAAALGERFLGRVLPDTAANPAPPPFFAEVVGTPHSVVTAHLIDADGEPTRAARDEILAFLSRSLHARTTPSPPSAPETAMKLVPPALDPADLTPRNASGYPEPFRSRVLPREKRALGDALGLSRIGVNLTTLFPGRESSMRHHHTHEDELVFVLEGEVVLRTDEGEQVLGPGMCAGFAAGSGNGHQLVNRGDRPARYLEISNRDAADGATYPDDDLAYAKAADGSAIFSRKDGSRY